MKFFRVMAFAAGLAAGAVSVPVIAGLVRRPALLAFLLSALYVSAGWGALWFLLVRS